MARFTVPKKASSAAANNPNDHSEKSGTGTGNITSNIDMKNSDGNGSIVFGLSSTNILYIVAGIGFIVIFFYYTTWLPGVSIAQHSKSAKLNSKTTTSRTARKAVDNIVLDEPYTPTFKPLNNQPADEAKATSVDSRKAPVSFMGIPSPESESRDRKRDKLLSERFSRILRDGGGSIWETTFNCDCDGRGCKILGRYSGSNCLETPSQKPSTKDVEFSNTPDTNKSIQDTPDRKIVNVQGLRFTFVQDLRMSNRRLAAVRVSEDRIPPDIGRPHTANSSSKSNSKVLADDKSLTIGSDPLACTADASQKCMAAAGRNTELILGCISHFGGVFFLGDVSSFGPRHDPMGLGIGSCQCILYSFSRNYHACLHLSKNHSNGAAAQPKRGQRSATSGMTVATLNDYQLSREEEVAMLKTIQDATKAAADAAASIANSGDSEVLSSTGTEDVSKPFAGRKMRDSRRRQ